MTNNNYLTLRKCAYIFDSTNTTYRYGTKEKIEKDRATLKVMRDYYENPEKLAEKIPYTTDENNNIYITVNNEPHRLNDLQIATIENQDDNIINHRKIINREYIANKTKCFHEWTKYSFYSNKFRTLQFEFFTDPEELGYIRVHFNRYYTTFIVDARTGELFTSGEHGKHQPTTPEKVADYLNIISAAAKKEFYEIINIIMEV